MIYPNATPRRPRIVPAAAALAALALAGCSSTHVGESWQCPLRQGGSCTSVAGADPAVPARAGEATALPAPLYRVRADVNRELPSGPVRAEEPCDSECGPFAWLARLFGTDAAAGDNSAGPESAGPESAIAEPAVRRGAALPAPIGDRPVYEEPLDEMPAPGDPVPIGTASTERPGDDLREAEVVGRIWIAPFVDGDGIYREGAYVRLVIAPARWRLP